MGHKSLSELFWILINIFGEVKHDDDPNVIGSDFDVFVIVIGFEKSSKEPIIEFRIVRSLASGFVCENGGILLFPQGLLTLKIWSSSFYWR
jgi:hypothetical protein